MRVIVIGMSLFLAVTFGILYRVSDDPVPGPTMTRTTSATAVRTLPILTPTPAPRMLAQLPPIAPTTIRPTPTAEPSATVESTLETAPVVVTEAAVDIDTAFVEESTVPDASAEEEPEVVAEAETTSEPAALAPSAETASETGVAVELAAVTGEDDADSLLSGWVDAVQTPDGGVIGVITAGVVNVRTAPTIEAEAVDELYARWPVTIYGEELGDFVDGTDTWFLIGPQAYISAAFVAPFVPPTPDTTYDGHWVDVSLSENYAVAYDGDTPVYAAIVLTGKPGFETPTGAYTIYKRVENEILDSATVGIPKGDPEYYYIPDVAYTQYFADHGIALHTNYWSEPWEWGASTSHGCVNLMRADAAWFWWFLDEGSVVNVHY